MNNVAKKIYIISSILVLVWTSFLFTSTSVQANNVEDWLEDKDAEIEEDRESPVNDLEGDEEQQVVGSNNQSLVLDLIKMVFFLFIILLLIYLLLRFLNKRNKLTQQVKALENLGGISVGQNKSIQIIRLGNSFYLIGVGENVQLLHEINDEEVKGQLLHKDETDHFESNNLISSIFKKIMIADESTTNKSADTNAFNQLFSNELNKLQQTRKKIIDERIKEEDKNE